MKILASVLILIIVSAALHAQTATIRSESCVYLRAAPRQTAKKLDCLSPGTTVSILGSAPYWRRVSDGDQQGWIAKKYLEAASGTPVTEDQWLEVHIVDVGQGDGIWIRTPDDGVANNRYEGRNIVIDGGPDASDQNNAFFAYLQRFAHPDAVIDTMIVTHPHTDHYKGARSLLAHYDVRAIYDPGYPKQGPDYQSFLQLAQAEPNAAVMIGQDNFAPLAWGDELEAEILYAYGANADLGSKANTKENNASIVLHLKYGELVFLFMGDAEGKERDSDPATPKYIEAYLLANHPTHLKANVLKIGHHGSETSSTLPFIEAVDPAVVLVSSGRKNFGSAARPVFLPDETTLARYCCHNPATRIYRTDQDDEAEGHTPSSDTDGDHIILRTNGRELIVMAHSNGLPITIDSCEPACQ
jgi:competence protein ComEC